MEARTTLSLKEARERLRQTIEEYVRLDAELRQLENTNYRVCIFGSARIQPKDPLYHRVFHIAQLLSEQGIDVVTGGGPGLMAAANRGVLASKRRRSTSYGLPLDLPTLVEPANRHLDIKSSHKRFSSRLDEFIRLSHAVVVAPGGIGTLLELMYVWQLLQLNTVEPRPVVLLGEEYWGGLMQWMREAPLAEGLINPRDMEYMTIADEPADVVRVLCEDYQRFRERQEQPGRVPAPEEAARAVSEELATELEAETEAMSFALREARLAA
ncbi:MAG: LOG family protein [Armatimonadota bacterium]